MNDALDLLSEFTAEYPAFSALMISLSVLSCAYFWVMWVDRGPIIDRNEWEG